MIGNSGKQGFKLYNVTAVVTLLSRPDQSCVAPVHSMSDSEAAAVAAQTLLDPPSSEQEAPTAEVQVDEEEVAYDEEPDEEQQADGHALPSSEDAHNEVLQQVAFPSLMVQHGSAS